MHLSQRSEVMDARGRQSLEREVRNILKRAYPAARDVTVWEAAGGLLISIVDPSFCSDDAGLDYQKQIIAHLERNRLDHDEVLVIFRIFTYAAYQDLFNVSGTLRTRRHQGAVVTTGAQDAWLALAEPDVEYLLFAGEFEIFPCRAIAHRSDDDTRPMPLIPGARYVELETRGGFYQVGRVEQCPHPDQPEQVQLTLIGE